MKIGLAALMLAPLAALLANPAQAEDNLIFNMVVSGGAASCLPKAKGRVTIAPSETKESMHVEVFGLPPDTDFDLFVIQVPKGPFGMSWYQGDIHTDGHGVGVNDFSGRFNIETFIVATGVAPAPVVHRTDASSNPATPPVHMFHLGLWFNSPADAQKAGCANTVTPFNGDHTAGIQVLNTANFPDNSGPLRRLNPPAPPQDGQ